MPKDTTESLIGFGIEMKIMFQIETNCSNLKLVKLPTKVPHATGYLDVSYNQVGTFHTFLAGNQLYDI